MEKDKLPKHVAIIMDGNGRWAQSRHLPRTQGHIEGVKRVEEVVAEARKIGIEVLTVYAFSTENWSRPQDEVSMLMRTFIAVLSQKAKDLRANGIKIRFIGRREGIPAEVLKAMDDATALTGSSDAMTFNVAFNYGGRAEIIDAIKAVGRKVAAGELNPESINEDVLNGFLYTKGQPDVDLLIRTSGELRISNFLLWQLSYAELYFTPKCWPEFNNEEFHLALKDFANRERRYGGVNAVL
jgi:undecaprenyl diphosphate synthase